MNAKINSLQKLPLSRMEKMGCFLKIASEVFDSVSDAVLVLDSGGKILDSNPAASELYGYGYNEMAGAKAKFLFKKKDRFKLELSLDRGRRFGKESRYKACHRSKGGVEIQALVRAKAVFNREFSSSVVFILIIKDITQRELVEDRLRKATLEAEAADIAKSQFLANISHEVRTPMNVVMGYAGLLKEEGLDKKTRDEFVDSILKNGDALLKLLDKTLDISNLKLGSLRVEKKIFALYPVIREIINEVEGRAQASGGAEQVQFLLEFELELAYEVKTDPARFKQVLLNLLSNSAKFTEKGAVRLRVSRSVGQKLLFEVSDTGIGIPKQEWKRLFGPFSQADESITRERGGSGLGLAVSKHLAHALGGNLYLKKSILGKGSVFEFWIKNPIDERLQVLPAAPGKVAGGYENLKNAKILLVEDLEENQALIKMYLRQIDCDLDIAGDGEEALDRLQEKSYDLILMDLQMPRLDGFKATNLIRKRGLKTPIIALTAHSMKEDVEKCMASGFNGHLGKPIRSKDLLLKANDYLS